MSALLFGCAPNVEDAREVTEDDLMPRCGAIGRFHGGRKRCHRPAVRGPWCALHGQRLELGTLVLAMAGQGDRRPLWRRALDAREAERRDESGPRLAREA